MKPTYAEVAQRCHDRLGQYNLDMSMYQSGSPFCGSSFCMLGDLAHSDKDFRAVYALGDAISPYVTYSEEKLGLSMGSMKWSWLFSPMWDNDIGHAKERCQYVIDNGKVPEDFFGLGNLPEKYAEWATTDF